MGDQTVIHYPFIQTDQNPHGSSGLTSLPELVVGRSTCDQEKVRGHTTAVDHVPTLLPEMPEARIPLLSVQQQHRFFFFFFLAKFLPLILPLSAEYLTQDERS